jgi:CheY-like chemotaxis protein
MACVLIVDDDPVALRLVRVVLQAAGHQILSAPDAISALQLLAEGNRPDLIISDVMMPGMLGTELVQRLATQPELDHVPVVLLSAYHAHMQDFKTAACMTKPFATETLVALVDELLAEPCPPVNSQRRPRLLAS